MRDGPAYYRPERISPEHAHLGTGQHLAVETMLRTLRSSRQFDPFGVFVPWAKQNGAVNWTTIDKPDHELVVYPVTAAVVNRVNAASYGSELPWIAVMTDKPVQAIVAEQAWDPTRYDLFTVEAVYDVDDQHPAPHIRFLYWAKLHDDVGGGRDSLDAVAKRLGGRLVFPVQIEIVGERRLPPLPFSMVLDAQLAAASAPVTSLPPRTPAVSGFGQSAAPAAVPAGPRIAPWLLALGGGAALWAFFSRPKRKKR